MIAFSCIMLTTSGMKGAKALRRSANLVSPAFSKTVTCNHDNVMYRKHRPRDSTASPAKTDVYFRDLPDYFGAKPRGPDYLTRKQVDFQYARRLALARDRERVGGRIISGSAETYLRILDEKRFASQAAPPLPKCSHWVKHKCPQDYSLSVPKFRGVMLPELMRRSGLTPAEVKECRGKTVYVHRKSGKVIREGTFLKAFLHVNPKARTKSWKYLVYGIYDESGLQVLDHCDQ